jgi:hypothetical protein
VLPVLGDLDRHPILGGGTASYREQHPTAGQPEQDIAKLDSSTERHWDTGARRVRRFRGGSGWCAWRDRRNPAVAGLGMATLVIVVTNTATETTELMITWLMLGLVLVAVDAAKMPRKLDISSE